MFQRVFYVLFLCGVANGVFAQKNVISGQVQDVHGNPMPGVTIHISNETQLLLLETNTDTMGCFYAELGEKTPFKSLQIQPKYQPAVLANHINTLDMIRMSRHIVGISPFEKNYQSLAADVNQSQTVTTADVMQLRDWLLGKKPDSLHRQMYEHFAPNNWQFTEATTNDDLNHHDGDKRAIVRVKRADLPRHDLAWVGFTSGDVAPAAPAQRPAAELEWPVLAVEKNTPVVTVPVVYRGAQPAMGLQCGWSFDPAVWELVAPSLGDVAGITEAHFGLEQQQAGKITFCWLAFEGETFPAQPGETLFYLTFRARQPSSPKTSPLQLDASVLPDGIWGTDETEYTISPATRPPEPNTATLPAPVTVRQLPTRTTLTFDCDRAGKVRVVLSNGWGHQITMRDVPVQAGSQEIPLDELQHQAPGVYSWWIKLPNGKMHNGRLVRSDE